MIDRGHRRMERLVDAHVDGELTGVARAAVADHLARCPHCRDQATLTVRITASLQRFAARRPPRLATRRLRRLAQDLARR